MVPLLSRLEEVRTFTPLKTLLLLALTAQLSTALDNGVGKTAGMGWSTWNTFGGSVSDALLRESADAMVSQGKISSITHTLSNKKEKSQYNAMEVEKGVGTPLSTAVSSLTWGRDTATRSRGTFVSRLTILTHYCLKQVFLMLGTST